MPKRFTNVVGFDDAPFPRGHRGDVSVVGAVYADRRLDGVLVGKVRKDGANAAAEIIRLVSGSKFAQHVQLVMLQGIALAGFNVVDVFSVRRALGVPALVVARDAPDMVAIRRALTERVRGGSRKWRLIERLGPMERAGGIHVQRVGLSETEASWVIEHFSVNGRIPEPIRAAHLIAGALGTGVSRKRA
jgi:endonuclease V-like protein UPF0215 family